MSELLEELRSGRITQSAEQTHALAAALLPHLPEDCLLALHGDLGAGKTTFTRGLAQALGIRANVTSPTFNLYQLYEGERQLLHFDAYRLQHESQLEDLLLEDLLRSPYLIVLEWPERLPHWAASTPWHLRLEDLGPEQRRIQLVDSGSLEGAS